MKTISWYLLMILYSLVSCQKDIVVPTDDSSDAKYFPPLNGGVWELYEDTLEWSQEKKSELNSFLKLNNTRGFMILKNGRIVMEEYWGKDILGVATFDMSSQWYWASAGKSLTATLVGLSQQEGYLNITESTTNYLGDGWTSMSSDKEKEIKIYHQLTMTTGLDYNVRDLNCTDPSCLRFNSEPGSKWYYYNAPYTLLSKVVEAATGLDYNEYTDQQLQSTIGFEGVWRMGAQGANVYWSTVRDAARFGLLILNRGHWNGIPILKDEDYFESMITTSQNLNPAYGYLWWLNGKGEIILPGMEDPLRLEYCPSGPEDLISAAGKNGQFIDIVPSEQLVMIRMGEAPDGTLVPITFHDKIWQHLSFILGH